MTIREKAMMILSACACEYQWNHGIDSAAYCMSLSEDAVRLARAAFVAARDEHLESESFYRRYAEAEAMLACGWTP